MSKVATDHQTISKESQASIFFKLDVFTHGSLKQCSYCLGDNVTQVSVAPSLRGHKPNCLWALAKKECTDMSVVFVGDLSNDDPEYIAWKIQDDASCKRFAEGLELAYEEADEKLRLLLTKDGDIDFSSAKISDEQPTKSIKVKEIFDDNEELLKLKTVTY